MYHITSDVPVLDPSLELLGVLDVVGDITDGVNVVLAFDAEVLVDGDSTVLLQRETRVLEELRGWRDTGTHDDEVGWDGVLTLQVHRAGLGRIGLCDTVSPGARSSDLSWSLT